MAEATKIWFVTWPDGKIFERSQTSISEDFAIGAALRTWLIPEFFPGLDLGSRWSYGPMKTLWTSMQKAGFKVHEIELPIKEADGVAY